MSATGDGMGISLNSVVAATKEQVSSDLAGETVVLSMQSAMYYGMDAVGSRIWELVRDPIQVASIVDAIVDEYDVDRDQAEADVRVFLTDLAAKGLIEVKDAA